MKRYAWKDIFSCALFMLGIGALLTVAFAVVAHLYVVVDTLIELLRTPRA